jgi:hypothetical protein
VEGDIQFLAFVVANGFFGATAAAALFLKFCLRLALGQSVHANADLGSSGQQRISLVAQ